MAQSKSKTTASIPDLITVLYEQVDLIKLKKVDYKDARTMNQTSNQIMNAYKLQLSAFRIIGKNGSKNAIKGLL
jgi:hypothetical protein